MSSSNTTNTIFTKTDTPTNPQALSADQTMPQRTPQPQSSSLTDETTPQQNPKQPQPHQPQSPAASFVSENLEDIDLRSPSDDPDYDFIDKSEAMHSARNAQPDRADKYPELGKGSELAAGPVSVAGGKGKEKEKVEAKKKRWGWFF